MAQSIVLVNTEAPGEVTDSGLTSDGTNITSTKGYSGTTGAFSGSLTSGGNFSVATNKFTVDSGTGNTLAAGTFTSTGALTASSTAEITGDLTVNTDKVTVAAATGNTVVGGTFTSTGATTCSSTLGVTGDVAVNTDKFTITAATGNTAVAGTLGVTGAGTFSSTLGVTGDVAVNTDKFTVDGATGNTLVTGTLEVTGAQTMTGVTTHAAGVGFGGTENAATSGAFVIPVDKGYQGFTTNTTDDISASLADGVVGQRLFIKLTLRNTKKLVVTPANLNGWNTITFDDTGEYCELMFIGTGWTVLHGTATLAA